MIEGVLFDYGNTLLKYCDFSIGAYAKRIEAAMRAFADAARQTGLAANWLAPNGLAPSVFDPGAVGQAVLRDVLAIEARARRELFEFDLSAAILRALAARFPEIDETWDTRLDTAVFGVMRRELHPRDDAVPMLRALKNAGFKTAIVSNTQFRSANHLADLRRDGMLEWLDATVFSIDVGVRKPRPEIFQAALDALGLAPSQAVFVGDSIEHDILAARRMGMRTILIRTPDNAALAGHQADAIIDDLSEIPALHMVESRME